MRYVLAVSLRSAASTDYVSGGIPFPRSVAFADSVIGPCLYFECSSFASKVAVLFDRHNRVVVLQSRAIHHCAPASRYELDVPDCSSVRRFRFRYVQLSHIYSHGEFMISL